PGGAGTCWARRFHLRTGLPGGGATPGATHPGLSFLRGLNSANRYDSRIPTVTASSIATDGDRLRPLATRVFGAKRALNPPVQGSSPCRPTNQDKGFRVTGTP